MAEVERMADRVIMLDRGEIVADATPEALIARFGRSNLEEVFLDIARNTEPARAALRSGADGE
jgi:ABC-2 type transport system ATP-binding protein